MISYKVLARNLFLWIVAVLIALKAFGFLEIKLPKHNKQTVALVQESPQPLMAGFELVKYENGKKSAVINAERLYLRDSRIFPYSPLCITTKKITELENVEVTFFRGDNPVATLTGKNAVMDKKKKNLTLNNNPILITSNKDILSGDSMFWDNSGKNIIARGNCLLVANGREFSAEVITSDPELNNFILGRAR